MEALQKDDERWLQALNQLRDCTEKGFAEQREATDKLRASMERGFAEARTQARWQMGLICTVLLALKNRQHQCPEHTADEDAKQVNAPLGIRLRSRCWWRWRCWRRHTAVLSRKFDDARHGHAPQERDTHTLSKALAFTGAPLIWLKLSCLWAVQFQDTSRGIKMDCQERVSKVEAQVKTLQNDDERLLGEHTDKALADLLEHTDKGFAELQASMERGFAEARARVRWQMWLICTVLLALAAKEFNLY